MAEFEVEISDEFEIDCPAPGCMPSNMRFHCPICKGEGKIAVWVEGTTTVDIEPPGY